LRDGPVDKMTS